MAEAYNVNQVAEKLKISTYAVKKLIRDNKLKAFKINGHGYIVNEKSLLVFLGKKIGDLIDKEEFEKYFIDCNKLFNGKVDKDKYFEYICSLFTPGPELPQEYFMIKDEQKVNPNFENEQIDTSEEIKSDGILLTKSKITSIIESLDKIRQILINKIRSE